MIIIFIIEPNFYSVKKYYFVINKIIKYNINPKKIKIIIRNKNEKIYYLIIKYQKISSLIFLGGILASISVLILSIGKFTLNFVNIFTSILTFLWGFILIKNLEKE